MRLTGWLCGLAAGVLVFAQPLMAQEQGFYIKPHINNITKDGATLIWEGNLPGKGVIEFGQNGAYDRKAEAEAEVKIQRLRMTGLTAGTTYNYRVACGKDVQEATFITAPAAARAITFAMIGDSRRWSDRWAETKMSDHMMQWKPEFVVTQGDLVVNGHKYDLWPEHFKRFEAITGSIWMVTARGNHEGSQIFDPENDWFAKYHELPGAGEPFADFTWGNTHFSLVSFEQTAGQPTVEWIDGNLPQKDTQYKIVAHHFPVYCTGYYGPTDNRKEWGKSAFKPLADSLDRQNVDLDLAGHTHIYERLYPIQAGERNDAEGVTYLINGGDIGANFPEALSAVTDDRFEYDQPTYTIFHMNDDRIASRTFCWSKTQEKIVEMDYFVRWQDEAVPKAVLESLKASPTVENITEAGAMAYRPAAEALLPLLDATAPELAQAAATAIRRIGIASISPKLIPYLSHADAHVRHEVARALEIAMEPGLAGAVAAVALDKNADETTRIRLIGALQFHAPKDYATGQFMALLKSEDPSEYVRERASYALARTAGLEQREQIYALFRKEATPYVTLRLAFILNDITGRRQSLDSKAPIARSKPGAEREEFVEKWESWAKKKAAK
ncbi:MAG: HEAT repeat domain-containing protein [Candidatus Hydrogenedentes bacterium]|nr:HEAT repeat domain-containing protein [Candidatus Hydrogenedentota bacterium]